jgi:hypothetical protein
MRAPRQVGPHQGGIPARSIRGIIRAKARCHVAARFILSDYVAEALAQATFEKLEDGS